MRANRNKGRLMLMRKRYGLLAIKDERRAADWNRSFGEIGRRDARSHLYVSSLLVPEISLKSPRSTI